MNKIALIVGARPNFMKIAPIERECQHRGIQTILIHTGQHYDYNMSEIFFKDLNIREPDIHLNVGSDSHAKQTAKIMIEFEKVCIDENPSLVLVVGDVNSTIACTIVAKKMNIPVAHVEAGLRSGDRSMPEEINRILTDSISDLLLTPSIDGNENLLSEGIPSDRIHFVGNIMIDSLYDAIERCNGIKSDLSLPDKYGLLTLHRPSNVDDKSKLTEIIQTIIEISNHIKIFFPIHPRTKNKLIEFGLMSTLKSSDDIILTEPLGYLDFIQAMSSSSLILTDSGGLQEETTALGIPCLTIRENTERPITILEGTNTLVGTSKSKILEEFYTLKSKDFSSNGKKPKFWDGRTSSRIIDVVEGYLND